MGCPAENHSFISQGFYSQLCNFRNSGSVDLHLLMVAVGEAGSKLPHPKQVLVVSVTCCFSFCTGVTLVTSHPRCSQGVL